MQRASTIPDMDQVVQALKELFSRKTLLQTAMQREDEGHSLVVQVHLGRLVFLFCSANAYLISAKISSYM
jgi:hypothetical protein